jgi:type III secretion protein U
VAERQDSGTRNEPPSRKRLRDARAEGDVWQSRDLTATACLVVVVIVAAFVDNPVLAWMAQQLGESVSAATRAESDVLRESRQVLVSLAWLSVSVAAASVLVCVVASALQVRGVFALRKVLPTLEHLNPVSGIKRILSWQTVVECLRLVLKVLGLGALLWLLGRDLVPLISQSQSVPLWAWLEIGAALMQSLLFLSCAVFGTIAFADLAYQRWEYLRSKRMSKEELKREHRDQEGDPILRGRRKHLHQEILHSNMLHEVRKASVVVVNPTHIAVALRYSPDETPLPLVVAKGQGETARAIREAAEEAGVPIYRDVGLARRLNGEGELNDFIPDELLEAVAKVLQWVDRLQAEKDQDR